MSLQMHIHARMTSEIMSSALTLVIHYNRSHDALMLLDSLQGFFDFL